LPDSGLKKGGESDRWQDLTVIPVGKHFKKRRFVMKKFLMFTVAFVFLFGSASVFAKEWPARPIEISCFASAGGGTDTTDRAIAKAMEPHLGVKINVVNRTGGAGGVAANAVWTKPHDGYYWGGFSESILPMPVMGGHHTSAKDWIYYMVGGAPGVISVPAGSKYKSLDDLVNAVKAAPGQIKASASASGCIWHTKLIALQNGAGINFNFVPFNGSHPSQVAAMTGEVDTVLTSISEQAELIKAKKLVPLAMIELKPYDFPGTGTIPAAVEAYPDVAKLLPLDQWLGFALPADVPKDVIAKVDDAFAKAMESDIIKDLAKNRNMTLYGYYGKKAQDVARKMESTWTWTLYELKIAKKSPAEFGIPKP
jgi:tripartite-type tricarboxylate transporter receptor subunit TctC